MKFFRIISLVSFVLFSQIGQAVKQLNFPNHVVDSLFKICEYEKVSAYCAQKLTRGNRSSSDETLYYITSKGMADFRLMKLEVSLDLVRRALKLASDSKDSSLIKDVWKLASYSYNYNGKLDSAMYFSERILAFSKRKGDLKLSADATTSIGTILAQKKDYKSALKLYKESVILNEKLQDQTGICIANYNIGLMFLYLAQYDSCVNRVTKALSESLRSNRKDLVVMSYGTLADCYLEQNKISPWRDNLNQAMKIAKEIGNYQFYAMGLLNHMSFELKSNEYQNAISYGSSAEIVLNKYPYLVLQTRLDSLMYVAYKGKGNTKLSLKYLESFNQRKNQFEDNKSREILNEFMVKYDLVKNELILAKQQIEINRHHRLLYTLLVIAMVLVSIVIFFIVWFVKLNKFRRQLFLKEKILEKQTIDDKEWLDWKLNKNQQYVNQLDQTFNKHDQNLIDLQNQKWLFMELREVFENKKLYLNPNIDLDLVVKELGTNKKYLYLAIAGNDENFRSFVNKYRVEEAKKLFRLSISNKLIPNIQEIAENSGFNSNVTFYRSFKSFTGLTPKEYINEYIQDTKRSSPESTNL